MTTPNAEYVRALLAIMREVSYLPIRSPERRIIEDAVTRGLKLYREPAQVDGSGETP